MNDWQAFTEYVSWFVKPDARVQISESCFGFHLPRSLASVFPQLSKLLGNSLVTPVSINEQAYQLIGWDSTDGRRIGWFCLPSCPSPADNIYPLHADLLRSFGGIIERFNELQDSWLINLNDALTNREASHDASFIEDYNWELDDAVDRIPIEPTEFYSIAREANGNTTICHRTTGEVILVAHDHSFDYVTPLKGYPPYSLYKLNGVETFRDWVETVAGQYLAHVTMPG